MHELPFANFIYYCSQLLKTLLLGRRGSSCGFSVVCIFSWIDTVIFFSIMRETVGFLTLWDTIMLWFIVLWTIDSNSNVPWNKIIHSVQFVLVIIVCNNLLTVPIKFYFLKAPSISANVFGSFFFFNKSSNHWAVGEEVQIRRLFICIFRVMK